MVEKYVAEKIEATQVGDLRMRRTLRRLQSQALRNAGCVGPIKFHRPYIDQSDRALVTPECYLVVATAEAAE